MISEKFLASDTAPRILPGVSQANDLPKKRLVGKGPRMDLFCEPFSAQVIEAKDLDGLILKVERFASMATISPIRFAEFAVAIKVNVGIPIEG